MTEVPWRPPAAKRDTRGDLCIRYSYTLSKLESKSLKWSAISRITTRYTSYLLRRQIVFDYIWKDLDHIVGPNFEGLGNLSIQSAGVVDATQERQMHIEVDGDGRCWVILRSILFLLRWLNSIPLLRRFHTMWCIQWHTEGSYQYSDTTWPRFKHF